MGGAVIIARQNILPCEAARLDGAAGGCLDAQRPLRRCAVPRPAIAAVLTAHQARRLVAELRWHARNEQILVLDDMVVGGDDFVIHRKILILLANEPRAGLHSWPAPA